MDSYACRRHGGVIVQHTRRAEGIGEEFVDKGGWRRFERVVDKLLPPSARTREKEATTIVLLAQFMRRKSDFVFWQLPFEK
jgi:hypothetical protein